MTRTLLWKITLVVRFWFGGGRNRQVWATAAPIEPSCSP